MANWFSVNAHHITLVADRLHKGLRPTRDKEPAAVTAADVS